MPFLNEPEDKHPTVTAVAAALGQLSRIRTLNLHEYPRVIAQNAGHLSLPAPALVHCSVSPRSWSKKGRLPDQFLGRHAPQLRTLSILGLSFRWDMIFCPSVVHGLVDLKLQNIPGGHFPNTKQLVTALKFMPNLRRMVVTLEWPTDAVSARPEEVPEDSVKLERLTYLCLSTLASQTSQLLRYLKVPPDTSLEVEFLPEQTPCDFSPLINMLANHSTCRNDARPVWRLVLKPSMDDEANYKFEVYSVDSIKTPPLCLSIPHGWTHAITDIISAIRISSLGCLEVELSSCENHDWDVLVARILNRGEGARKLVLRTVETFRVIIPLLLATSPILLPSMRRIHLDIAYGDPTDEDIDSWHSLLRHRYEATGTMLEMHFSCADELDKDVIDSLGAIAGLDHVLVTDSMGYDPDDSFLY